MCNKVPSPSFLLLTTAEDNVQDSMLEPQMDIHSNITTNNIVNKNLKKY